MLHNLHCLYKGSQSKSFTCAYWILHELQPTSIYTDVFIHIDRIANQWSIRLRWISFFKCTSTTHYLQLAHDIRQLRLFGKSLFPFLIVPLYLDTSAGSLTAMGQYILYIICVHRLRGVASSGIINPKLPLLLPDCSKNLICLEWLRHSVFKLRIIMLNLLKSAISLLCIDE